MIRLGFGKGKERVKKRILPQNKEQLMSELCLWLLYGALGALTSSAELLFATRPFGVALLASATVYFPAVLLGGCVFCLATGEYLSLIAFGVVAAARIGLCFYPQSGAPKGKYFAERIGFRMLVAAVPLLGTGLYRLIAGEFRFFDLFGLLLSIGTAVLCTFLYAGVFEEKDRLFHYSREAGLGALILTCVFAMRTVSFFGIYPAARAATLLAFFLSAHRGVSWGAVGGALAGLCFEVRLAPAFLLCGLLFGLLEKSSRGGGILVGGGAATLWAFAVMRTSGVMLLLPSLLTAGALFLAGDSAGLIEGSPAYHTQLHRRRAATRSAKERAQAAGEAQLRELSGALCDLSGTFFELSARLRRPGTADLRRLCDRCFDAVCPQCKNRDVCWGSEYQKTAGSLGALGATLYSRGRVGVGDLDEALALRCTALPSILEEINAGALRLSGEALRGDRTSVIAADYAAVGRIIGEALEDQSSDFETDPTLGERVGDRLQRLGYSVESVAVCGKRHRSVILCGVRLPGRHIKIRELRRVLEQHCHFQLGAPHQRQSEGVLDITFPEREHLCCRVTKQTRAKGRGEGKHCGDCVGELSSGYGYDYTMLCDGMGSGNMAALTSALASAFLSRILQAGTRAGTALRMLNGFLSARGGGESSTTVDLLQIDRTDGEAALFKCGAAPSFLLRRGEVTRFHSRTAPVGILEALDAERIRFSVKPGDVIVQVSDGVTKGEEDCPWLCDLLRYRWNGDAEGFARNVLASAEGDDDLSVVITEIVAAPPPGEEVPPGTRESA